MNRLIVQKTNANFQLAINNAVFTQLDTPQRQKFLEADADTPFIQAALELLASGRAGIVAKLLNAPYDTCGSCIGKSV